MVKCRCKLIYMGGEQCKFPTQNVRVFGAITTDSVMFSFLVKSPFGWCYRGSGKTVPGPEGSSPDMWRMCGEALDVYSVLPQAPALDLGRRAGCRERYPLV